MKVPWLQEQERDVKEGLGISLSTTAGSSSLSVLDVSMLNEKPGVQTPSRKDGRYCYEARVDDDGVRISEDNTGSADAWTITNGSTHTHGHFSGRS